LIEDFATYIYLSRVRDENVLIEAIRSGLACITWNPETFAYAESWDEQKGRYQALVAGRHVNVIADGKSVLVKPEVAARQIKEEQEEQQVVGKEAGIVQPGPLEIREPGVKEAAPAPALKPRRFHGSVKLNPLRIGRDASRIGEEVVQHLSSLMGADVEVTLEIEARIPDGAPEKTVRDVTENCQTLKFNIYGFEVE
jgi:hypothetical protein